MAYLFALSDSATTAASAIELSLTSNVSDLDVRITGASVPVMIHPFLHFVV